jgi:hypothetical protein
VSFDGGCSDEFSDSLHVKENGVGTTRSRRDVDSPRNGKRGRGLSSTGLRCGDDDLRGENEKGDATRGDREGEMRAPRDS